jgi:hypothetical protein
MPYSWRCPLVGLEESVVVDVADNKFRNLAIGFREVTALDLFQQVLLECLSL